MFITRLEALHFRNLAPFELDLTRAPVLLVGQNAQGKTNTLEALAVCTTGRSFRTASARELLAHGRERGRIGARLVRHDVRHDVAVELTPQHRHIHIDGRGSRYATRLLELVNLVSFFPDDLRIAKGNPEERRRFLDRAIANHRPDFIEASLAYAKALKARNAILRSPQPPDRAYLEAYDEQLVRHGALVHACREETLAQLAPLAQARFDEMMPRAGGLELHLMAGVDEARGEGFGEALRLALSRSYPRDRARGMTSVGPHRADLLLAIAGRDARAFASQGQQRTIVLALKLAELEYLRARLGATPILLLDDVSSELDTERSEHFFTAASHLDSQLWVSTTGVAPLPLPRETQRFSVCTGVLERLG